ncbi:MAG: hypothetical protein LBD56_01665 [Endomicrobium sp.]|jgi:hypothetical protein|nr:hypothetical protein [Endomicrobium sp.]
MSHDVLHHWVGIGMTLRQVLTFNSSFSIEEYDIQEIENNGHLGRFKHCSNAIVCYALEFIVKHVYMPNRSKVR